ncbi:hypothetical protein niasHS_016774 [Heterodera schachtii]|uniref:Gland protein n=1 Tax=Heterodera schachtii TaxID=97005 RepID=A0ABD2I3X7_HETSC
MLFLLLSVQLLSILPCSFSASLSVAPAYSTKQTCLSESSASDSISAQLNTPITGGQFTFYGIGGRGACGLDIDTVWTMIGQNCELTDQKQTLKSDQRQAFGTTN